jgi:hypothetical protein
LVDANGGRSEPRAEPLLSIPGGVTERSLNGKHRQGERDAETDGPSGAGYVRRVTLYPHVDLLKLSA